MIKGGKSQPGGPLKTRSYGLRCRRGAGTSRKRPPSAGRRVAGGLGLAGLATLMLWGSLLLGLWGCNVSKGGYGRMGEYPGAFGADVRPSPEETARRLQNAHYFTLMGRADLALKELEQAHRQNPDNLQIVNTLAHSYEELGQFETARQLYGEALTRRGPHPAIANNLCFTYYQEGRWQEAEACYRHTLAGDPRNTAARNNLGLLYCRLGRQEEARRLWQEAEGAAAADDKTLQALAALGMTGGAVYAQKPTAAPTVVEASNAPAAANSSPPATLPRQDPPPPQPANVKSAERQLAATPPAEAPRPVAAKPRHQVRKLVAASPEKPLVASPGPASRRVSRPLSLPPLTCAELVDTAIEVRNGTRTRHLARETRSRLSLEGYNVVQIGNHLDFGAAKTMIFYRPEAERVARVVAVAFFPGAALEPSTRLKPEMDIKILLGADLLKPPPLMARLVDE